MKKFLIWFDASPWIKAMLVSALILVSLFDLYVLSTGPMARWRESPIYWKNRQWAYREDLVTEADSEERMRRVDWYTEFYGPLYSLWGYEWGFCKTSFIFDFFEEYVGGLWGMDFVPGMCLGTGVYSPLEANTERITWQAVRLGKYTLCGGLLGAAAGLTVGRKILSGQRSGLLT